MADDVVARMDSLVEETVSDEMLRDFIVEAFKLEKRRSEIVDVTCTHCRKAFTTRVSFATPDYRDRAKAVEMLLNRTKGRPKETVNVTQQLHVRTLEELEGLTLEDLARLAGP